MKSLGIGLKKNKSLDKKKSCLRQWYLYTRSVLMWFCSSLLKLFLSLYSLFLLVFIYYFKISWYNCCILVKISHKLKLIYNCESDFCLCIWVNYRFLYFQANAINVEDIEEVCQLHWLFDNINRSYKFVFPSVLVNIGLLVLILTVQHRELGILWL